MSLHILAAVANGVLEKFWPSTVPPHDYDTVLADAEAEFEAFEPSPTIHTSGDRPLSGGRDDTSAAGGEPPRSSPAALPTADWLAVAVCEVLAEHEWVHAAGPVGACACDPGRGLDVHEYREHVAPIVAAHTLKSIAGFRK